MPSQVRRSGRIPLPFPRIGARVRSATTTIVAIGVVAVAVVLATWINTKAQHSAVEVSRAIDIRERAERFLGHMRDAETGQRGYLLTGEDVYLDPFEKGRAAALPELDGLEALMDQDAAERRNVALLRSESRVKLAELEETITLARSGRRDEAIAIMRGGNGIATMESLRDRVQRIQDAENIRLVALGRAEERRRLQASFGIIVALSGLAFAAWMQLRTRQRRSALLVMSNAELEQVVTERTRELEGERMRIEALLKDVNHRVGNNLAMVSALLNVQARQSRDEAVRAALAQAQARIQAIAAGQRRLRLDIDTDEIEARPYMEDLLAEIGKAADGRPVRIDLAMDAIRLPGRDAISYVVIVNELVTNAIKHAFPGGIAGHIVVRLEQELSDEENACVTIRVEDDGVGMQPDAAASKGLGQTVIASLLRSMRATMTTEPLNPGAERPGTRITLRFPKRD